MGDSPKNSDSPPWENEPQGEVESQPSAAELEAAGQNSMFGDPGPAAEAQSGASAASSNPQTAGADSAPAAAAASDQAAQPYRVLARKYRPQTFSELIGQEPMVRTLGNAIERDRLAHAFLMTGVRGVGKTSTARLIAKALNCIGPDGQGGPTIDPCGQCEPCTAIAEGRHIDVIEMDAASHTGVDDVREIIEAVRYAAVSARYKIYIIDEVHMLSRNAFNALLKTLEEPPAHVKFLFATTEVEKLPVTVLSRTQRFDLRRIPAELLQDHFGAICEKEGVEAEPEALNIIANAAEGSVRDGLSILDQAIAHADLDGEGKVTAERVRDMLGLADKSAQRKLLQMILDGDAKALLGAIADQYALGVEPLALMRGQMDLVHRITVAQVSGGEAEAPTAQEREALTGFSQRLTAAQLHRLWQLMLKGHEEVRQAPDPLVSAQMALLRVLHAADLPDPGKLAKRLEALAQNGAAAGPSGDAANPAAATSSTQGVSPASSGHSSNASTGAPGPGTVAWKDLVQQVDNSGQLRVAQLMHDWVRVVELSDGHLIYAPAQGLSDDLGPDVRDALLKVTGKRWQVELAEQSRVDQAQPSLREQAEAERTAADARRREHPLVKATLEAFPEAELLDPETNVAQAGGSKWNR